jgi:hypothetical protein
VPAVSNLPDTPAYIYDTGGSFLKAAGNQSTGVDAGGLHAGGTHKPSELFLGVLSQLGGTLH